MDIEKVRQKTVVEQVMTKIKELIASGQFKAGDRLPSEHDLAESFGVGRSTIREAMKIFQHLGIVSSQVAKGTFVCDGSKVSTEALTWSLLLGTREMFDIVELREVLEHRCLIELVTKYAESPESIQECIDKLEGYVSLMERAMEQSDVESFIGHDYRFHEAIFESSHNPLFSSIYHTLKSFMMEEIDKSLNPDHLEKNYSEHKDLLMAIKSGNPDSVEYAYRTHIQSIVSNLKSRI